MAQQFFGIGEPGQVLLRHDQVVDVEDEVRCHKGEALSGLEVPRHNPQIDAATGCASTEWTGRESNPKISLPGASRAPTQPAGTRVTEHPPPRPYTQHVAKREKPAKDLPPMHRDMDERIKIPMDPETALKGLLETDPDDIDDEETPKARRLER